VKIEATGDSGKTLSQPYTGQEKTQVLQVNFAHGEAKEEVWWSDQQAKLAI